MVAGGRKRSRQTPVPRPTHTPLAQSPLSPLPPPSSPAPSPSLSPPLTAPDLTPLMALLAASVSFSIRFAADLDLLLLPSQTIALEPLLLSAAHSLSRLLSLLPLHLQTLTLTSLSLSPPAASPPLTSSWFLRFVSSPSSSDDAWRDAFRMPKPAFYLLLQSLSLSTSSSSLPLPPDHKLGAALFRLAHAAPARTVARRFGLPSPAVAARAFYEVCLALADRLAGLFDLSTPDRLARVVQGFCALSLPNCCGALGYAQFPIEADGIGDAVIAQGLVDADGRFLDVSVGWHGSMAPAKIITQTKLYNAQSMVLANAPQAELIGGTVPRYFLGGSCCPLLPWLLTPFKEVDAGDDLSKEGIFNNVHAQGMQLVRKAFRNVRAQWRLLGAYWKGECREALPYVVVASCLLHNFLIKCGEPILKEVQEDADVHEFADFDGKGDEEGERIREVLAAHLSIISHNQ